MSYLKDLLIQQWPSLATFKWELGKTPFLDPNMVIGVPVAYLVIILLLHIFMRRREAIRSTPLTVFIFVHNTLLSVSSAVWFVLMANEVYEDWQQHHSFEALYCDSKRLSNLNKPGFVQFLYYGFYLSKYYELIDTVVLLLKRRPIIFLHVYHHFITVILAWISTIYVLPQWTTVLANLTVHTFMYYYYAMAAIGRSVSWKKHMTTLQILQFVVDLGFGLTAFGWSYYNNWCCIGDPRAWIFGQGILLSFLILFIQFFLTTYLSEKPHSKRSASSTSSAANGKKRE